MTQEFQEYEQNQIQNRHKLTHTGQKKTNLEINDKKLLYESVQPINSLPQSKSRFSQLAGDKRSVLSTIEILVCSLDDIRTL